jgi:hypothetical protein
MRVVTRFILTFLLCAALLVLTSCFGATRLPTRQHGSSGQKFDAKTFDPTVVQPGTTTRDEVLANFSMINTGYQDPHFFWGRWATSKWGYWWMVIAASPSGGGGASGAGDAKRIWHVHNMLLTFDDAGVAQTKLLLDDDPSLWRELNKYAGSLPAMNDDEIISLAGRRRIALSREWIEIADTGKKHRTARVSPDKIVRIAHAGPADKRASPGSSCHVLYLSEKTTLGNKFRFCAEGSSLMATLHYLHRYASPNMKWE